jgi:group I intron endonuclease
MNNNHLEGEPLIDPASFIEEYVYDLLERESEIDITSFITTYVYNYVESAIDDFDDPYEEVIIDAYEEGKPEEIINGIIYKLSTYKSEKVYIGLTTKTLHKRMIQHKCCARDYGLGPDAKYKSHCHCLYRAMNCYGFDTFVIEVIDRANTRAKLNDLERHYIREYNSVSPGGYNLTLGGADKLIFTPERRAEINKAIREGIHRNIDKMRQSEESKGLPVYMSPFHSRNHSGYRILKRPKCDTISFSVHTYGSDEAARKACLDFIHYLDTTGATYKTPKAGNNLPRGIVAVRHGFRANRTYKGKRYRKEFCASTPEQNMVNALAYLAKIDRGEINS